MSNTNKDSKQVTKPKRPVKAAKTEKAVNSGQVDKSNPRSLSISRKTLLPVQDRDPNMHYRWVNDVPGALAHAQAIDYDFVIDTELEGKQSSKYQHEAIGSAISMVVDSSSGMKAYLMQIPKDLYAQHKKTKAREVEKINEAIYGRKDYRGASVDPRVIDPNKDHLSPVFTGSDQVNVSHLKK